MIAIIDYDAGNLKSVEKALQHLGQDCKITRNAKEILEADKVILPGVGAFADAMEKLQKYDLIDVIHQVVDKKTPFLGICLGLQLMFESSEEGPGVKGLGLLPGKIVRFPEKEGYKIPHMGWNSLKINPNSKLLKGIPEDVYVYFVHSYYAADCEESVTAYAEYSALLTASVENGNVYGTQFHPEKSGEVGLGILKAFCEL